MYYKAIQNISPETETMPLSKFRKEKIWHCKTEAFITHGHLKEKKVTQIVKDKRSFLPNLS